MVGKAFITGPQFFLTSFGNSCSVQKAIRFAHIFTPCFIRFISVFVCALCFACSAPSVMSAMQPFFCKNPD